MSEPVSTPAPDSAPAIEPATLLRRLAALTYDALALLGLLMCFTLLMVLVRGGRAIPPGTLWFELCLFGIAAGYFAGLWTRSGQTLGMRAWHIRLVAANGALVPWRRALLRFGAAWLSLLPAGLGYWWSLMDPQRRCWHDRLAGTRVVRERRARRTNAPGSTQES